jgi:hypothetical protein
VIACNALVLALYGEVTSAAGKRLVQGADNACLLLYTVEVLLRLWASNSVGFFRSKLNLYVCEWTGERRTVLTVAGLMCSCC